MKCRKVLSVLFSVVMICSFLGCFLSGGSEDDVALVAEAAGYDPAAAAAYAEKHWNNYNANYSNYNSIGGDCANFVSQCLFEGGLEMTDGWYWKSYSNRSESWSYCPSMYTYFKGKGYEIIINPSASDIVEGNPILYAWDGETWGHAAICVGKNSSGVPIVAAHNNDYRGTDWKMGAPKTCTIIIPSNKTNTVKINYHTNGGTIATNEKYYAKDSKIYKKSDDTLVKQTWGYNSGGENGLYNASTFKLSRTGYTFLGWSTSKSGGKVFDQDDTSLTANDIFPDIATKSGTVTMYAQWKKNILTMNYNTNGGQISENETYYAVSDGNIYKKSDSKIFSVKWGHDYEAEKGLYNASTFNLTRPGYKFTGWSLSKTGGTVYDQSDNTIRAATLFPDIYTKSGKVMLYAQWKKNILTMNYNTNGGQISENETYYAVSDGNIYKKSDSKIFSVKWGHDYEAEKGLYNASTFNLTRPGYKFTGWSLSKTGGTVYDQSDNTIRAATLFPDIYTKSGKVMLYAQWKENTLTINYNINGGTISSDGDYYAESNGNIYEIADKTAYAPKWNYTYESKYGLTNASTFKLTREGYTFLGWSTSPSGGDIFDQDDLTIRGKDLFPDILTKSGTVTMYAQWKKNEIIGDVNIDGKFNVTDVVLLQKWILGSIDTKLADSKKADMNKDGKVDAFDLCLMKRELIKK